MRTCASPNTTRWSEFTTDRSDQVFGKGVPKASLGRWVCRGCLWLVTGAGRRRHRSILIFSAISDARILGVRRASEAPASGLAGETHVLASRP
jgi:hypothetical protein